MNAVAGAVVTGAGAGIGAALARRLAAEGTHVVVADIDGDAARAVAGEIGGLALQGDASSEAGVRLLIDRARAALGAIDLFCANAGVAPRGGAQAPEEAWARAWEVNVMAHVRAAGLLLPGWLEAGRGHFLATVSAAGLLTSLGSAPYAVTKHGALAFAEWLFATYRHRGIRVQAVCPQGVRTRMLTEAGRAGQMIMGATAITPERVAEEVVAAMKTERFLILPHAEVADYYAVRATRTDQWLQSMNRLQQKVEAAGEDRRGQSGDVSSTGREGSADGLRP